jgi:hypothetical protein
MSNTSFAIETPPPSSTAPRQKLTRQDESDLVNRCTKVARGGHVAECREDADIYRFLAQLLKTRFPVEAHALENAAIAFFDVAGQKPRTFPQVVDDGLVQDVPRFRHVMEHALAGVKSW